MPPLCGGSVATSAERGRSGGRRRPCEPMQIISLRTRSFRSWKVAEGRSKEATERLRKLESLEQLRAAGCRPDTARSVTGWSRATCHRWRKRYRQRGGRGLESKSRRPHRLSTARWTPADEAAVRRRREKSPFFGKRRPGGRTRQAGADRPHDRLSRRQDAQGVQGRLPDGQVHDGTGILAGYRRPCEAVPGGRHRGPAGPAPVDPGRRRQRIPRRVRGRRRGSRHPAVRPAPEKPQAERGRGTGERPLQGRVLEPVWPRVQGPGGAGRAGRLSALLQLHEAALCPGNDDPDGVPSAMRITETLSLICGNPR